MRLINNSNREGDRMQTLIRQQGVESSVLIASAFFNDDETLLKMVDHGCDVQLIVRLGVGTSPEALARILGINRVDIRFYTGRYFHPKFYIFGSRVAYLGSSNFTKPGLLYNQEANVEIDGDEPVFEELQKQFFEYWNAAEVLDEKRLATFKEIIDANKSVDPWQLINNKIGEYEFDNVGKDGSKHSKSSLYISSFKRAYQRYISKFNSLKDMYERVGLRRFPEIPIRVEVDRFLWWIREEKAQGQAYQGVPIRSESEIEIDVKPLVQEFIHFQSQYLVEDAVPRYQDIASSFGNKERFGSLDTDQLYRTLLNVHAFNDRFRFFEGGHPKMKETFLGTNDHEKIRTTIEYLLYGSDQYETRISNCVNDSDFKLNEFGESCVKELYGLVNENDIPICNGRTLKSMEWLGFGKL
jgi:hypothetical protein